MNASDQQGPAYFAVVGPLLCLALLIWWMVN